MWVVIDTDSNGDTTAVVGPFDDQEAAENFAEEQGDDSEAFEVQAPA